MDKLDRKILELLQHNGELTAAEVADRVGLSKAPCWRRIKKLREEGVIKQTVALVDARTVNVGTTVFVMLKTAKHNQAWFDKFVAVVRDHHLETASDEILGDQRRNGAIVVDAKNRSTSFHHPSHSQS